MLTTARSSDLIGDDIIYDLQIGFLKVTELLFGIPSVMKLSPGHEDWVRGLDFAATPSGGLLASSSQDHYIRLWNLARDEDGGGSQFKLKEKIFEVQGTKYR